MPTDPLPSCNPSPSDPLSTSARLEINEILRSDEELIWTGMPKQGLQSPEPEGYMLPMVLIFCMWTIFALYSGFILVLLIMIPVVGFISLYRDMCLRENTLYGLTNKRIIILSGLWWWRDSQTPFLTDIMDIYLDESPDGSGKIRFGNDPWYTGLMRYPDNYAAPRFKMLPKVRPVFDIVVATHKAAKKQVAPPAWM